MLPLVDLEDRCILLQHTGAHILPPPPVCSFGEHSTAILSQAGAYEGPEAIAEYIRFLSQFSPFFDDARTLNSRVDLLSSDSDICTFRAYITVRLVASDVH
jgi:hypothetical protein